MIRAYGRFSVWINVGVEKNIIMCSHTTRSKTCSRFNAGLTWFRAATLEERMHEKCVQVAQSNRLSQIR